MQDVLEEFRASYVIWSGSRCALWMAKQSIRAAKCTRLVRYRNHRLKTGAKLCPARKGSLIGVGKLLS